MYLLDTDFLIAVLKRNPQVKELLQELEGDGVQATTIFNAQELLFGASLTKRSGENTKKALEFLSQFNLLNYDVESMRETVEIKKRLRKTGEPIGVTDERIAGIAMRNQAVILTRNLKHFNRIPGLKTKSW